MYKDIVLPSHTPTTSTMIVDTGVTSHYISITQTPLCSNVTPIATGSMVNTANKTPMQATHTALLPLTPTISHTARQEHVLDYFSTGFLISIWQLCDNDCVPIFTKYNVFIAKNSIIHIKGHRNHNNGLLTVPITPTKHRAYSAISTTAIKQDHTAFLHGAAFSPIPSTFFHFPCVAGPRHQACH